MGWLREVAGGVVEEGGWSQWRAVRCPHAEELLALRPCALSYLREVRGWKGLLMDGGYEDPTINLHKEIITPSNIVSLFSKYSVPRKFDLLSIDTDQASSLEMLRKLCIPSWHIQRHPSQRHPSQRQQSHHPQLDLFLMDSILRAGYRPRVLIVEFNRNFAWDDAYSVWVPKPWDGLDADHHISKRESRT